MTLTNCQRFVSTPSTALNGKKTKIRFEWLIKWKQKHPVRHFAQFSQNFSGSVFFFSRYYQIQIIKLVKKIKTGSGYSIKRIPPYRNMAEKM